MNHSSFFIENILFRSAFLNYRKLWKTFLKLWDMWKTFKASEISVSNLPYKNYTKAIFGANFLEKRAFGRKNAISELYSRAFVCGKLGNGKMYFYFFQRLKYKTRRKLDARYGTFFCNIISGFSSLSYRKYRRKPGIRFLPHPLRESRL